MEGNHMSEYTPTTDDVRRAAMHEVVMTSGQFDRWLAARDLAMKERIAKTIEGAANGSERGQSRPYLAGMLIAADVARGEWPK
jgi:hypothetical protein